MSVSCRILIFGLFLTETIWWVNGAAVPSSLGNMQPQFQKEDPDSPRNGSAPTEINLKSLTPMEQMRLNNFNLPPPPQPFGIVPNMNMFQMPPPPAPPGFVMMPQPPGFRPGMMMMMQPPPPNMANGHVQHGQPQLPKREIPAMHNSTIITQFPLLNSNTTHQNNNNTRRETEANTNNPTITVQPPVQEMPQEQKESDGSKMRQTPLNPFLIPQQHPQPNPMGSANPMLQQFNPMLQQQFNPMIHQFNPMMQPLVPMNQPPLFIDSMGRLMMLVPYDPSRLNLAAQAGPQRPQGPQGPPLPIQIPFGQPQLRPVMPDLSKQPPRLSEAPRNETDSS